MKKKRPYKEKWWFGTAISATAVILVAIPFIINESYKVNSGYITMWGASDMLSFYGAFLGFIGTVALGALALFQNKQANEINARLSSLEKERFKLELQPFVLVTNWKMEIVEVFDVIANPKKLSFQIEQKQFENINCFCMSINFTNTSNTYALVNYISAVVYHNDNYIENWSNGATNQQNLKLYLQSGETGEIIFYCSKEKMLSFRGKKITLELLLENRFGDRYKQTIDIVIAQILETSNGWYLYISPQNYQIRKYIRENGKTVLEDE